MVLIKTNIKTYRTIKELTQEDLANRVGVRRETIMRLENAKYNPSLELAVKISKELDTTV
ncbi:helix-turn-helix transcriptional regulator [Leuconostoc lactis]|uniref:helix-turn-helix transcriptional regulator n=1 Tax=Leuconostoc lactis TaxID=1246 RepID=UPI0022E98DFA|nr:helix-turn-helix domain-containing protein [Leuconostoc lactis]